MFPTSWLSSDLQPTSLLAGPFFYMQGLTPQECLAAAIDHNDLAAVSYVTENMRVDYSALDAMGRNPLHKAIEYRRNPQIIELLIEKSSQQGQALYAPNRHGFTPLMLAYSP